ncbi:Hypothetical predicted protein [Paramuricea clavata]|uniref:Uncharacterized protein n=1 Tax=Paramuricea clavata TaxID=317549 RepID=A0A6S7H714_PARCT|nr:Hypothetical predicted protein [Paramuricea clavata]
MGLITDVFCLFKCPQCDCVGLSLEEDDVSRKGYVAQSFVDVVKTAVGSICFGLSMNIPAGKYTEFACHAEDKSRVSLAQYKSTPRAKKRRKLIRGLKKKKEDKNQETEGLKYGAGEF